MDKNRHPPPELPKLADANCAKNPQSTGRGQPFCEKSSAAFPSHVHKEFCRLAEGRLRPRHGYRSITCWKMKM